MLFLTVDNVWTWIKGDFQRGLLDPVTSYTVPGAWFSQAYKNGTWDGKYRYVKKHRKSGLWYFPTGFLSRAVKLLEEKNVRYALEDQRDIEPANDFCYELIGNDGQPLRLDQGKYAYQAEAVDSMLTHGRGILAVSTGGGKSECGAAVIKSYGLPAVWFTDRRILMEQTKKRLETRLGCKVGMIGDGVRDYQDVTVAMIQTLRNQKDLDFLKTRRVAIGDEIHRLESATWFDTFCSCPAPFRFGLSATPSLENDGMNLLAMTGDIIYSVTSEDLISRGVLVPPRIWIVPVKDPAIPKKTAFAKVHSDGIVFNDYRNRKICEICEVFKNEGKPTLLLVNRINHGKHLLQLLKNFGLTAEFICGDTSHKDRHEILERLKTKDTHILVGMSSIFSEGFDAGWLRAIINATGSKCGGDASKKDETGRDTIQILGRGLRSHPGKDYVDYVDFADACHKYLSDASLARIGTLREEGFSDRIKYWDSYSSADQTG